MRNAVLTLTAVLVAVAGVATAADLPDLSKTPGVTRALTKKKICSIKWGLDERHVSAVMKRQAFAAYGYTGNDDPRCIPTPAGRHCEVDHLISRELGGADVLPNLWPQSYGGGPWNAVRKDRVENRLHKEVCAGRLSLAQARRMIVQDWTAAYVKYFGQPPAPT
jgi:hypothetical protein